MAKLCRKYYGKKTSFLMWISIEIAIIGADIQEVIGTAIAFNILFGIKIWIGVLITIIDAFLILLAQSFGMRKLEVNL